MKLHHIQSIILDFRESSISLKELSKVEESLSLSENEVQEVKISYKSMIIVMDDDDDESCTFSFFKKGLRNL